jgi:hypothetical protein
VQSALHQPYSLSHTQIATIRMAAKLNTRDAGLYMERREELGYPLGTVAAMPEAPPPPSNAGSLPGGAADFVLEVGCEELPPSDVTAAMQQLRCLTTMADSRHGPHTTGFWLQTRASHLHAHALWMMQEPRA